jgi:molybdate transport repressor ModE-like protein
MKKDALKGRLEPSYTVSLNVENRRVIGELEARMLRAIDQTGSLSLAARTLDLSYPFLWNTISRIERAVNENIVARERGGQKGGRAELTKEGKDLLQAYSELDSRVHRFLKGESLARGYMPETGRARPNLSFVGSHCIVVEKILTRLRASNPGMTYQMVNVGSWAGMTAMMLRETDIAGIHLYDETESRYNEPLLSKYWLSNRCTLVRGYKREQCLMVRKGNPKEIRAVEDLLRHDVKLVNRNVGSGTRILLDLKLRELARKKEMALDTLTGRIRGYDSEMMTHREVAAAVVARRADVGIGLTSIAAETNLDFIPLGDELYDFLVEKRLRNPYAHDFFNVLASKYFQREIESSTVGIKFLKETGRAISQQTSC